MKKINYEKINNELKGIDNWCCFKEVPVEGRAKPNKTPVNANTCTKDKLYNAKSNDNSTWSSYQVAENKSKALNIGLMYRVSYPYMFLDFDDCIDDNGNICDTVKQLINRVNSYTEISNSGKGIHTIVKVTKDFKSKVDHNQGIEIYTDRFCCMTGDVLEEYSTKIEDRTEIIEEIYNEYFKEDDSSNNTVPHNEMDLEKEAKRIIANAKRRKSGEKFNLLYKGEWEKIGNYPSHSEADLALMILLAECTNKNAELMDYIFRKSGLYREEKYDQKHYADGTTYGQALIANAMTLMTDFSNNTKISLQEKVINALLESIELFHNSLDECFAIINMENHKEIYNIETSSFLNYVSMLSYKQFNQTISTSILSNIKTTLKGIAIYNSEEKQNYFRCYQNNNVIYYDLSNKNWQVVEIDKDGWRIREEHQILFTRESHQKPQVIPNKNGNIDLLWKYIKLPENEKILFICCLCSMYIPDIPRPLIMLHGEKGASKTTTSKMVRELVDPSIMGIINLPEEEKELVQILSKHYVVPFDNIGYISDKISNSLCRAVTGEAFSKRKLFSDNEDVYYIFRRSIIINGIAVPAKRPDLLDRSILFRLERIKEEERIDETSLWNNFYMDKPYILGGIFDILSKAIEIYNNTTLTKLYRLADFTKWGYCIAKAYNQKEEEFIKQYEENKEIQNDELVENNIVIQALLAYLESIDLLGDTFTFTSTELYDKLTNWITENGILKISNNWIKSPKALHTTLQDYKEILEKEGLLIEFTRDGHHRYIHIKKTKD